MRAWAVMAGLGLMASTAVAELKEPETGTTFEDSLTVEGTTYQCLGTGVRKILWIKAYALTYCLADDSVAPVVDDWVRKTHAGQSGKALSEALRKDATFYARLARQPGNRLVVMKMTRDVSRSQLASSFEDSLSDVLPADSVKKLVDSIPGDAKKGETVRIWSQGATVTLDIAGKKKTLDDAAIAQGLWDVWLSGKSVTPSLRASLARETARRLSGG